MKLSHHQFQKISSYEEWLEAAMMIDDIEGNLKWRHQEESDLFHSKLVSEHLEMMKTYRQKGQGLKLINVLLESLQRHSYELNNSKLYSTAYSGTKYLITDYLQEVELSLNYICDNNISGISDNDKLRLFLEGNRIHGNTVLMLSGGASFGIYHIGVVKALWEQKLLPTIISGSSMGAIVAAAVCSKSDEELRSFFNNLHSTHKVALRMFNPLDILQNQSIMDKDQLLEHIQSNVGNYTFQEAFEKTGRVLNISVSATRKRQKPKVLNHITTPNVLIQVSALASCAIPGIFPPVSLLAKNKNGEILPYMESEKWIDGSVHLDIPMQRIMRLHNVSRSIVSQANPHVLPFVPEESKLDPITFLKDIYMSTVQAWAIKFLDVGVVLSDRMPWLSLMEKFRSVMNQEYRGDINISYPMDIQSIFLIFNNPSQEQFEDLIKKGEMATYPKIAFIRDQQKLNKVLEDCIFRLKNRI
jgi:TAG lipase / steryl ester hydrolase / phospholipase A2 / LPA acyltransferase